jgi:glutamine amidotransferase
VIAIVDYGAGNLRSVENTLSAVGADHMRVRDAASILKAGKLVLPGVGHFGQMMRALDALEIRGPLTEALGAGVPFLGICLGLHALFTSSEEAPEERGLGIVEGEVKRFRDVPRVPHMGWNELENVHASDLLRHAGPEPYVYFAHSYFAPVVAATTAVSRYGVPFTAVLEHGQVRGVQFHPEKSGDLGLAILRAFAES